MEETLDQDAPKQEVPQAIKTLSILTYVGSGIWALLFLIVLGQMEMVMDMLSDMPEMKLEDQEQIDMIKNVIYGVFSVMIVLCILSIIGAVMMTKLKRSGFILYAVGSGLFGIIMILGMQPLGIVTGIISIVFIFLYGKHLKLMR